MLHMLQCNHPAATAYCSCLGAMHARGGAEGWSDAWQRAREAEGDGGRGAGVLVRQEAEGARAIRTDARSGDAVSWEQQHQALQTRVFGRISGC
jgi:hypothetical protein